MSVRGKQVQNGTYEFDYMRVPDTRTRWEIFRDGIYNPQEGTYCGHPPKKWGYTLIFYACFYAGLAILFSICMKGMLATLSYEKPKWTLSSSLIGTNPGLGFRPISDNPDERSLIWYSASNETEVQKWTNLLDTFLEQYINSTLLPNGGTNQQICNYTMPPKPRKVCAVDVNNWGPCAPDQQYGFNNSAPCIFIKLNRIYGWVPEYYNDTEDLPAEMPESLVSYIKSVDASWGSHGFPGFYYPYENIPGYLSPVVAVHFLRPTRNQVINVECRAWAKNIQYSSYRSEKKGAVHFELMVDE
ncbi:hypothetical protein DMN91_008733 [Ooceraea biroi]|uniref:Sodium/potassium-transporting ATPase subunit beta-2 n=1 Tax=Ooceraea biroi TaxID=2015173 RepID=A0A3L8DDJ8_OOCBI|nr:hypothetical protein DMN91_008733 [Ooceraea biroi]